MVSFKYLYFSLREGWLVILEKSLMSSLRPVKYEVTLLGWYVYLICESLTGQNRHSIFLNLSVISTFSKCGNLVVRKMMFTT